MPAKTPEGLDVCTCPWCADPEHKPMALILFCPRCAVQHVDEGEWATRPHQTHLCVECGYEWRPALINTVGVESIK